MDSEWFQLKGEQIDLYDVVHSDGLRVYSPFLPLQYVLKVYQYCAQNSTYEYERLGTDRACTVLSANHVPRNSRYDLPITSRKVKNRSCDFFLIENCAFF